MIVQGQIEEQILVLVDELEKTTDVFATCIEETARADVAYKRSYSIALAKRASDFPKETVAVREAKVITATIEELAVSKILGAKEKAVKEKLISLRSQLDALRTLSANVRAQT